MVPVICLENNQFNLLIFAVFFSPIKIVRVNQSDKLMLLTRLNFLAHLGKGSHKLYLFAKSRIFRTFLPHFLILFRFLTFVHAFKLLDLLILEQIHMFNFLHKCSEEDKSSICLDMDFLWELQFSHFDFLIIIITTSNIGNLLFPATLHFFQQFLFHFLDRADRCFSKRVKWMQKPLICADISLIIELNSKILDYVIVNLLYCLFETENDVLVLVRCAWLPNNSCVLTVHHFNDFGLVSLQLMRAHRSIQYILV